MNYLDVSLAVCGVLLIIHYMYTRIDQLPLPPGPKALPIIGNMLDMPKQKRWETFSKWGKKYGDIVHISLLGKTFIIVNTFDVAFELFERRSSVYSGRSQIPIMELIGFNTATVSQQYGTIWRKHRTLYNKQLGKNSAREFQSRQMDESRRLLRSILDSPHQYRQHLRHMAAGIVMSIAYAYDILPRTDPFVDLGDRRGQAFNRALRPGAYLVDLIPALKHVPEWVPGAKFQKFARESRKVLWQTRNIPFDEVKRRMASGTAKPSFVSNSLTEQTTDEDVIRHVAEGIYGAGTDTTVALVHSFILAMVLHPEVQKRAQAELDNIIGGERLPDFQDRLHLPYVEAVVKEALRWNPVAPTGIPHMVTEDDVYHGYRIPKGAIVIGNSWAMLHDSDMYPDPYTYRPERFLPDESGIIAQDPAKTGAFGFGRRICPGRHLADASLWIAAASLLAVFDITPAADEHGREIDVHYALEPHHEPGLVINHPRPFPCSFKPRSKDTENLIRMSEHKSSEE